MTNEEQIALILSKILSGKKRVNKQVGIWRISNRTSPFIVDFFSDEAIYGFQIQRGNNLIEFINYHREAAPGYGTVSLSQLESAFRILARLEGIPIAISFITANQKDTISWLIKNGYRRNIQWAYYKILKD